MADEIIARNPPLPELTEKAPHTPALTPWATPPDGSRWAIFVLYLVAAPGGQGTVCSIEQRPGQAGQETLSMSSAASSVVVVIRKVPSLMTDAVGENRRLPSRRVTRGAGSSTLGISTQMPNTLV